MHLAKYFFSNLFSSIYVHPMHLWQVLIAIKIFSFGSSTTAMTFNCFEIILCGSFLCPYFHFLSYHVYLTGSANVIYFPRSCLYNGLRNIHSLNKNVLHSLVLACASPMNTDSEPFLCFPLIW